MDGDLTFAFPELGDPLIWSFVAPEEAAQRLSGRPEEWLAPVEQEALAGLQAEGRRREWCAGRLAVKRVVRQWLEEARGMEAALAEVAVTQDARGAPQVAIPGRGAAPSISIAHTDGYGFAALAPPEAGVRVGVDIERLREISPRLLERLLGPGEAGCAAVQPPEAKPLDGVTLWTLKEAALKALGVGLRLPMRCLAVEVIAPGRARIHRAPGSPTVDDFESAPWTAIGTYSRWAHFAVAIVTVRRDERRTTNDELTG